MNTDYEIIEYIKNTILELLTIAGFKAKVEYEHSLIKGLMFYISVDTPKLLIGRQGSTLQAFEHLIFSIVNNKYKFQDEPVRFNIDVDDYKLNRQWQLKQLVKDAVIKLKHQKEPIYLPVMPRYERKFIHTFIQEQYPHINTESSGDEPNRQIVMKI